MVIMGVSDDFAHAACGLHLIRNRSRRIPLASTGRRSLLDAVFNVSWLIHIGTRTTQCMSLDGLLHDLPRE